MPSRRTSSLTHCLSRVAWATLSSSPTTGAQIPAVSITAPLTERGPPCHRLLVINGAGFGSAGYGDEDWAIGESYADMPVQRPAYYTPSAPEYRRWRSGGIATSDIPRMYHSTASLLPDGSVFVAGSAPSADMIDLAVNTTGGYKFATEFRVERFYVSRPLRRSFSAVPIAERHVLHSRTTLTRPSPSPRACPSASRTVASHSTLSLTPRTSTA